MEEEEKCLVNPREENDRSSLIPSIVSSYIYSTSVS